MAHFDGGIPLPSRRSFAFLGLATLVGSSVWGGAAIARTDTIPPAVTITAPADGATITVPYTARISATDNRVVDRVTARIDSASFSPATCSGLGTSSASCTFTLPRTLSGGPHTLTARAVDRAGNVARDRVSFSVGTTTGNANAFVPTFTDPNGYYRARITNAPVDPQSDFWINSIISRLGAGFNEVHLYFSHPTYLTDSSDPPCTTNGYNYHLPQGATADARGRAAVIDYSTGWGLGTTSGIRNGCLSTVDDAYRVASNGLAEKVIDGTIGNIGHRGAGSARKALVPMELYNNGAPTFEVSERMQCAAPIVPNVHGQPWVWPMYGGDAGTNVTYPVPQGAVLRLKSSVNVDALNVNPEVKAIFRGLQDYGCLVVDGGAERKFNLAVAENYSWTFPDGNTITEHSLSAVPFSSYEFIKAGYDPVDGQINGQIQYNCTGASGTCPP